MFRDDTWRFSVNLHAAVQPIVSVLWNLYMTAIIIIARYRRRGTSTIFF